MNELESIALKNCTALINNIDYMIMKFFLNEPIPTFEKASISEKYLKFVYDLDDNFVTNTEFIQCSNPKIGCNRVRAETKNENLASIKCSYLWNIRSPKINQILVSKDLNEFEININSKVPEFVVEIRRDSLNDINSAYGPFDVADIFDEAELFQLSLLTPVPDYMYNLAQKMMPLISKVEYSDQVSLRYSTKEDLKIINLWDYEKD